MNPSQLAAQAQQAATQGQNLFNSDNAQAASAKTDYGNYQTQANQAQQNQSDYANYMKNEGSGTNLYNTGLAQGEKAAGYNEGQAGQLGQQLAQAQNALANVNQASQSSTGGYGLSGAQLGSYYATQATPITSAVNSLSNSYGASQQALANATTIGNQYAGAGLQNEATTSKSLNDVFNSAKSQSDQALQNMQFYSQLASTQGGMNASNTKAYNDALNAYQQGKAAMAAAANSYAQAGLARSATISNNQANAQGAIAAQYTRSANGSGGFNYNNNGTPITVEQYNAAHGRAANTDQMLGQNNRNQITAGSAYSSGGW